MLLKNRKMSFAVGGFLGDPDDPKFKTEAEHINYYRQKAIEGFDVDDLAVYNRFLKEGGQHAADSFIAARGGLPAFNAIQKEKYVPANPTNFSEIGFSNTGGKGGYRYKARGGEGLPAKDSITKEYATGGELATAVAPYISNLFNATRRLPKPALPVQEQIITPDLVNFDADRASLNSDLLGLNKGTDQAVSNPGVANALRVANLSKFLGAKNQLAQTERNLNAGITNQTKQFNSNLLGRNIQRQNNFNEDLVSRTINQQRLDSENLANATDKFQLQTRDNNQQALESGKLEILKRKYKDTGVIDRDLLDLILKNQEALNAKQGQDVSTQKYGGNLKKFLK